MSKINTGGAAFPGEKDIRFGQANDCNEGMTLRDYFAAKVMQSWICAKPTLNGIPLNAGDEHSKIVARICYKWADAMIKAREA